MHKNAYRLYGADKIACWVYWHYRCKAPGALSTCQFSKKDSSLAGALQQKSHNTQYVILSALGILAPSAAVPSLSVATRLPVPTCINRTPAARCKQRRLSFGIVDEVTTDADVRLRRRSLLQCTEQPSASCTFDARVGIRIFKKWFCCFALICLPICLLICHRVNQLCSNIFEDRFLPEQL